MTHIIIIAEGQTEETFVRDLLVPVLAPQGFYLKTWLIPTSATHKGGALSYSRVQNYLVKTLKQWKAAYVTTFFDLYALDNAFPGYALSQQKRDVYERVAALEEAFHQDIIFQAKCRPERFVPYIQPYEFEGLLFADTERLVEVEPEWQSYRNELATIRQKVSTPELINDGPNTHPSARLKRMLSPSYRKTQHGPLAMQKIGLEKIRQECPHFANWYTHLTQLPPHD